MKPITPEKVQDFRIHEMPEAVIQAVNELILRKWNGHQASFKLNEVVDQYFKVCGEEQTTAKRKELFENHYLDIEPAYRNAGWKVEFDRPGYNEDYDAYFVFSKKK